MNFIRRNFDRSIVDQSGASIGSAYEIPDIDGRFLPYRQDITADDAAPFRHPGIFGVTPEELAGEKKEPSIDRDLIELKQLSETAFPWVVAAGVFLTFWIIKRRS